MINIKNYLSETAVKNGLEPANLQFPDCELEPAKIKVIMISEVPPQDPDDGFYSNAAAPDYMRSITTAVKSPKTEYAVDSAVIKAHLPVLEAELALFPGLEVIMLMGDVAKKAVNMIAKAKTKKNIIPSESTYKIRHNEYYWGDIRVFPSYIMTGGNILIEKSKREMIADDIRRMIEIIK